MYIKKILVIPRTLLDPILTLDLDSFFFPWQKLGRAQAPPWIVCSVTRVESQAEHSGHTRNWLGGEFSLRVYIPADVKKRPTCKQNRFHQQLPSFQEGVLGFPIFIPGLRYRHLVQYSFTGWSKRGSAHCAALRTFLPWEPRCRIMKLLHHPCRLSKFVSDTQWCFFLIAFCHVSVLLLTCYWFFFFPLIFINIQKPFVKPLGPFHCGWFSTMLRPAGSTTLA